MFLLSTTIRILIFELPTVIITSEEEREMSKIPERHFTITKRPKKKKERQYAYICHVYLLFDLYTVYIQIAFTIYKINH